MFISSKNPSRREGLLARPKKVYRLLTKSWYRFIIFDILTSGWGWDILSFDKIINAIIYYKLEPILKIELVLMGHR